MTKPELGNEFPNYQRSRLASKVDLPRISPVLGQGFQKWTYLMTPTLDRRLFLASLSGVAGAGLTPTPANADEALATPAVLVPAAEARMVWALGVRVSIIADFQLTGGAYAVFEDLVMPQQGPPLHTHTKEDETMYVLEGELEVVLGDSTSIVRAGDFSHMARGVPHRFKNISDKPARMLLTYSPGGFEQWFLEVGTPVGQPDEAPPPVMPADIQKAVQAAEGYGVVFAKKKA